MLSTKDVEWSRKSPVSYQSSIDPDVSEWGNPAGVMSRHLTVSKVAVGRQPGELNHLSTLRNRNQIEIP